MAADTAFPACTIPIFNCSALSADCKCISRLCVREHEWGACNSRITNRLVHPSHIWYHNNERKVFTVINHETLFSFLDTVLGNQRTSCTCPTPIDVTLGCVLTAHFLFFSFNIQSKKVNNRLLSMENNFKSILGTPPVVSHVKKVVTTKLTRV